MQTRHHLAIPFALPYGAVWVEPSLGGPKVGGRPRKESFPGRQVLCIQLQEGRISREEAFVAAPLSGLWPWKRSRVIKEVPASASLQRFSFNWELSSRFERSSSDSNWQSGMLETAASVQGLGCVSLYMSWIHFPFSLFSVNLSYPSISKKFAPIQVPFKLTSQSLHTPLLSVLTLR